jgi:hypothetical protein
MSAQPCQGEMGEIRSLKAAEAMLDKEVDSLTVEREVRFENNEGEVPDELFLTTAQLSGKGLELVEVAP